MARRDQCECYTLHAWEDVDLKQDIDSAMALTSCMDAVVTSVSSVYEMSGALGVPTFAFHPPNPCLVSLGTEGVPYHPSVRLFRRRVDEDWSRVFAEITSEIGGLPGS